MSPDLHVAAKESTVTLVPRVKKCIILELKSGVCHPREKHDRRTKLCLMLQSVGLQL